MDTNAIKLTPRADAAKCEGIRCAFKQSCGRFLRPDAEANQAWSAFYAMADDDCAYFEVTTVVAG
jgi:hypothetical protein